MPTNDPDAIDPVQLEKIRNNITLPILQDARRWLIPIGEKTEAEKVAYSDGLYSALALVFTHGAQLAHTMAAIDKLFFNISE